MSVTNYEIIELNKGLLQGSHFKQTSKQYKGVIVTFGGSEGGSNYELAKAKAELGYEVLSLYFFGKGDLPVDLKLVPLEIFESMNQYIEECGLGKPITFISASKGAELCLNFAEFFPDNYNMILYAPSAYRFQGLEFREPASSWTIHDQQTSYLSFRQVSFKEKFKFFYGFFIKKRIAFKSYYQSALDRGVNSGMAKINVENFDGNLVLFAGSDDQMWNSAQMALTIKDAIPTAEIHIYQDAGHCFDIIDDKGMFVLGGTSSGNKRAFDHSEETLATKLSQWHTPIK